MSKRSIFNDTDPLTWACSCGQINLWEDRICIVCDLDRADGWDTKDERRCDWTQHGSVDGVAQWQFAGYDHEYWKHRR